MILRYDVELGSDMVIAEGGNYVRHEDYAAEVEVRNAIARRCAALEAELKAKETELDDLYRQIVYQESAR